MRAYLADFLTDKLCDVDIERKTAPPPEGHVPILHTHPQFELYFCPDSVGQVAVVDGIEYTLEHPTVILVSPFTVHSMIISDRKSEKYDRTVVYFDRKILTQFDASLIPKGLFEGNNNLIFKLDTSASKELGDILTALSPKGEAEIKLALITFLNRLSTLSPPEKATKAGNESFYIREVMQYIADNFSNRIDSDSIALHFLISRSKLDKDFRHFTGISVHAFLNNCRINHAKMLLENNSEMSVSQISAACGFGSETHFFPSFRKTAGMTPLEYRKSFNK